MVGRQVGEKEKEKDGEDKCGTRSQEIYLPKTSPVDYTTKCLYYVSVSCLRTTSMVSCGSTYRILLATVFPLRSTTIALAPWLVLDHPLRDFEKMGVSGWCRRYHRVDGAQRREGLKKNKAARC